MIYFLDRPLSLRVQSFAGKITAYYTIPPKHDTRSIKYVGHEVLKQKFANLITVIYMNAAASIWSTKLSPYNRSEHILAFQKRNKQLGVHARQIRPSGSGYTSYIRVEVNKLHPTAFVCQFANKLSTGWGTRHRKIKNDHGLCIQRC